MKKLVTAFMACALIGLVAAQSGAVESVNVVGYQTVTANVGVTAIVPTFVTVGGDGSGFSLENLIVSGQQDFDTMQILSGDAVAEQIIWVTTAMGVSEDGWYDESYTLVDLKNKTFATATGFYVALAGGGAVTYQGEVKQAANTVPLSSGVTLFGTGRPYPVKFSDITITGQQDFDTLQVLSGDAIAEQIIWVTTAMGVPEDGWYDESYTLFDLDQELPDGFGIYASFSDGGMITIPNLFVD